MKQYFNFLFIVSAILFQACGGIFGKYAAITIEHFTIFAVISNTFYMLSLCCMFLQAIVWQQALKHYKLSFAYPFMSLVNFVILFASFLLFNESITTTNIIGLVVISIGISVLSMDGGVGT
jgi:multidrug transporter EmrE-like cation transporter